MISYSASRTTKKFKMKIALLSLGMIMGLAYETFAKEAAKKQLTIEQNSAEVLNVDKGTTEIFVANPEVADVSLQSSGTAYIYGKKPGNTTVFVGGKEGKSTMSVDVHVTYNVGPIKKAIAGSYPTEDVQLISTPSGIVIEGEVTSPKASKDIANIVQRFVAGDDAVINNMGISSPTQVYLQVKVAEVRRTVLKQLDINWGVQSSGNTFAFGLLQGRQNVGAAGVPAAFGNFVGAPTGGLNTMGGTYSQGNNLNVTTLLDALSSEGLSTVLAEPNLIALSGETAKVLVGGEVPYPVPQGSSTISIEFKQYGISLDFTPTILSANRINLRVRPEVSELDRANGYNATIGVSTVNVPAFTTRRAETSVEISSGDSLAIAGLFSRNMSNTIKGFPFLQDVPILGALFRSTQFQRNETELVIIVTPFMVDPISKRKLAMPLNNLKFATHLGMILGQRLNHVDENPADPQPFVVTQDIAATGDMGASSDAIFEKPLASTGDLVIPANDQSQSADNKALSKPDDLSQLTDTNLAGVAGFHTE